MVEFKKKFSPGDPVTLDFKNRKQIYNVKIRSNFTPEDIILEVIGYKDDPNLSSYDKRKDTVECKVVKGWEKLYTGSYAARNRYAGNTWRKIEKIIYVSQENLKFREGVDLEEYLETWDSDFII